MISRIWHFSVNEKTGSYYLNTADKCWFISVSDMCRMEGVAMKLAAQLLNSVFINLILQTRPHFVQYIRFQEIHTDWRWNKIVTLPDLLFPRKTFPTFTYCWVWPLSSAAIQTLICVRSKRNSHLHWNNSAVAFSKCFKSRLPCLQSSLRSDTPPEWRPMAKMIKVLFVQSQ